MTRTSEDASASATDRMTMTDPPADLHVDMTGLDDGDEASAPNPVDDDQLAAFDKIGELH